MTRLGILAKYWQPGTVKTRLAVALGAAAASDFQRCALATLLTRFQRLAETREVVFTPADRRADFRQLAGDHWRLVPQVDGDLGARMTGFFTAALASGAHKIVLIGADSPTLPLAFVREAFDRLDEQTLVLGPSPDGGYYLVGAAGQVPPVFDEIEWSTPRVWSQTTDRLRQLAAPFACLPEWYDVDTLEDLQRLRAELGTPTCADSVFDELRVVVERYLRTGQREGIEQRP